MPELPEVETTLRGIRPHIIGRKISKVSVRNRNLRWPVSKRFVCWQDQNLVELKEEESIS